MQAKICVPYHALRSHLQKKWIFNEYSTRYNMNIEYKCYLSNIIFFVQSSLQFIVGTQYGHTDKWNYPVALYRNWHNPREICHTTAFSSFMWFWRAKVMSLHFTVWHTHCGRMIQMMRFYKISLALVFFELIKKNIHMVSKDNIMMYHQ